MKTIMLLGSGELGRELTISLKRLGCFVVACDSYERAPAMQVADHSIVFDMLDAEQLDYHISICKPDLIVPEIEAIATQSLLRYDSKVVPNADAVDLTMNRDKIRDVAQDECELPVLKHDYCDTLEDLQEKYEKMGSPKVVVKPVMSSSGKGQSIVEADDLVALTSSWHYAVENMRGDRQRVIVEEFYDFDYEITVLTTRTKRYGTLFSPAIIHRQRNGDFYYSSQSNEVDAQVEIKARQMAQTITDKLGGYGLYGVEFFVKDNDVIFSELSPRPHDTGLLTLFTQNLSEFDLHARAILNLPIPSIEQQREGVCMTINAHHEGAYIIKGVDEALKIQGTEVHLFAKDKAYKGRRLGIVLAPTEQIANEALKRITVEQTTST
jgi:phosphoribosylglycinamide formyltransferase 2